MGELVGLKPSEQLLTLKGLIQHGYMTPESAEQVKKIMLELMDEATDETIDSSYVGDYEKVLRKKVEEL